MKPLNKLLNEIQRANKNDAWDYTGGHLNHSHLVRFQALENKHFWKSGRNSKLTMLHDRHESNKKLIEMKDAFAEFSNKTSSTEDLEDISVNGPSPVIKQTVSATPINTPFASSALKTHSYVTYMESVQQKDPKESLHGEEPELSVLKRLTFSGELYRSSYDCTDKYTFAPTYFSGLTKYDQFRMFLQFEKEVFQKQDLKKDFHKNNRVEHYETKLTEELRNIAYIKPPNFARVQIVSNAFENICSNSSVLQTILHQIKNAYKLYFDYLLEIQSCLKHEALLFEISGMKKRPVQTKDVDVAEQKVKVLEQEAWTALQHNDQLRINLKNLNCILITERNVTEDSRLHPLRKKSDKVLCPANEGQTFVLKRSGVLKTCHEIKALEEQIKKNMTHALNAEVSEQYIKDVQSEIVKLQSSNTFLLRANKDLDSELKRLLMKQKMKLGKQEEIKSLMDSFLKSEQRDLISQNS